MLQQALDFRQESDAVFTLLDGLDDQDWGRKTQFKEWTLNDIIAHLHMGNHAADLSLQDTKRLSGPGERIRRRQQTVWPSRFHPCLA